MAALAIGGHILGAVAGIAASRTEAAAAKFQGAVAATNAINESRAYKFNAQVAEQQAKNTMDVARAEGSDFARAGSAALASRRAKTAAGGVVATAGSPLMVDTNITQEIEFGRARIINQGDIVSTRQKNEAKLLRAHAKQAKRNAVAARQGANIAASAAKIGMYSAVAGAATGIGNTLMTGSGGWG